MEVKKNTNHKGFKIFVLLFLIGILFFMNKDNQIKVSQAYKSLTIREKDLEEIESISMNPEVDKLGLFDKNIAIWGKNKLSIVDINNNILLEKQFNFEEPDVVFGQKSSYIMDKSSGDVYTINSKGETIERMILEKEINNLVEDNDNIIVHTKPTDENLVFINSQGVFLRIHPIEDMKILTYSMDKDSEKYLISNLNIEDELLSELHLYSISGDLLDKIQINNEIIIFTKFIHGDLIVLSDKCLYYIRDSKIYWKRTFSDIKDILLNEEDIYILYGENLEGIDLEGKTINKFSFDRGYDKLKSFEDYIFVIGNNNLIAMQEDKKILNYSHHDSIDDIIVNKDYLAIIDDNSLNLYRIKNK